MLEIESINYVLSNKRSWEGEDEKLEELRKGYFRGGNVDEDFVKFQLLFKLLRERLIKELEMVVIEEYE